MTARERRRAAAGTAALPTQAAGEATARINGRIYRSICARKPSRHGWAFLLGVVGRGVARRGRVRRGRVRCGKARPGAAWHGFSMKQRYAESPKDFYNRYLASAEWRKRRADRIAIDGGACVVCKHDGSIYPLQVHHIHYGSLGNEDVIHDLMTVCARCHDLFTDDMRLNRYADRVHITVNVETEVFDRKDITHGLANGDLQIDVRRADARSQWADRKPAQQMGQGYEIDLQQAQENRRRS